MKKELLINIPKQYEERFCFLEDEGKIWLGKVLQFIKNTQDYISQSPFFFPEYTKHTVEHINNVLEISIKLIPDETMQSLNADAIAVLIMGIISHDIGMFIKPDGLEYLLNQKNRECGDGLSWKDVWKKYQTQLNHYSSAEIEKKFGDPSKFIINDGLDIMQLPCEITTGELSQWRIRLCGEFLREMHPRLAQEIIEEGFPGKEQFDLFSNIEIDEEYRKLIGIVVRSHGMSINGLDSKLKVFDEDAPEYPCELPIYYIMAILRLADYFDAGKDRAPHALMAMQHFEAEASYEEFKWNQTVNLGNDWGERVHERVFVNVKLSDINSRIFLKVEEWLRSLQRELDVCWRQISLYYKGKYQFSVRRIGSNIFQKDTRKMIETKIVIEKARLQAASEILDLLIAPLYGGEFTYGVREMLQNAIDACRERKVIENERGNNSYVERIWIEINSDCEQPYFSIIDNGCGMNKEIILQYFLVAGSSYRNSMQWQEKFENQSLYRNGRFGIGVLASFLLGEKIEVETKSFDEKEAYFFQINKQNYAQINISRHDEIKEKLIAESEGGTHIRIEIDREIAEKMAKEFGEGKVSYLGREPKWMQWYWLPTPIINYIINGKEWKNSYACVTDKGLYGLQKNGRWFQLKTENIFDAIWWTPEDESKIWCNGIFITSESGSGIGQYGDYLKLSETLAYDFYLKVPSISIMDSKKMLDVNLSRNEIQNFPEEIRKSLYIENCKLALSLLMMVDFSQQKEVRPEFPFTIKQESGKLTYPLFCKEGYNLPINRVLQRMAGKKIWLLYKDGRWDTFPFDKLDCVVSLLHFGEHIDIEEDYKDGLAIAFFMGYNRMYFEAIQIKKTYINNFCDETPVSKIDRKRNFSIKIEELACDIYDDYFEEDNFDEIYDFESEKFFPYVEEINSAQGKYLVAARNADILNSMVLKDFLEYFDVACGYKVIDENRKMDAMVEELLDEYLGKEIWIPYDIAQRKKKFPKFFDSQNEIYKYVTMVGKKEGFYDVKTL